MLKILSINLCTFYKSIAFNVPFLAAQYMRDIKISRDGNWIGVDGQVAGGDLKMIQHMLEHIKTTSSMRNGL